MTSINLLLLISEMEGTYQHLKYMGFEEDMNTIDEMHSKKNGTTNSISKNQKKKRMRPETRESMEKLFTAKWNLPKVLQEIVI